MGLMADLGRGPLGVDTIIFIYFIEEHPRFLPLLEPLFREVDSGRRSWLPRRLLCWKFWSFRIVREIICWPSVTRLFSHGVAAFVSQRFRATIASCCAVESHNRSEDAGLSSACGSFGGWLYHFSYEWSRPPD